MDTHAHTQTHTYTFAPIFLDSTVINFQPETLISSYINFQSNVAPLRRDGVSSFQSAPMPNSFAL